MWLSFVHSFFVKIDSLPGTEEALLEDGGERGKAPKVTGPVSIVIYLFFLISKTNWVC